MNPYFANQAAADGASELLAARSQLFDRVLSSVTDFIYTFDLDGRFTFINKPLLDLWGLSLAQAVGKNFFELKYPEDLAAKLQSQIQEVIRTRRRVVDETPYTSPSGSTGYYQYIFSPVIAADGAVEAVAGSTRDISEQKRHEAQHDALARTVEVERLKLASIIEQAPAFICTLRGPEHIFELANELYYEIIGKRQIIGKTVREALPEIEGQGFFEILDGVYTTGEPFYGREMPVLLRRTDDESLDRRFMNFVYQAIRESGGGITGIFVHGIDVTETVRAREALRQSEHYLRAAIDSSAGGFYGVDRDGITTVCNTSFARMLGFDRPEDAVGRTLHDVIHHSRSDGSHYPKEQCPIYQAARTGRPAHVEDELFFRLDGTSFPVEYWSYPIIRDGTVHGAVTTFVDITERKRAAEELRLAALERERLLAREQEARAEAETASRAKDKFLAVLSHELRTPLSPVVMTIPAIEMDPDLPFKFREDLAMVRRNIDLEVKLIDDLLDLSRVTSGKLRLHMQPVHVHDLLRHVLQSSASDLSIKRLQVRALLGATNDRLTADPARLQQVFWNLLRNAIKFTPEGGAITVRTSNACDAGKLLIEVTDTGVGMPPDVLPRVFDAFEQGELRMTRQFGGLGLGLAIAKAVIEMHGGAITAASYGRDQGSTFTVELGTSAAPAYPDAPAGPGEGGSAVELNYSRVLLVEDHPDTARTLAKLLRVRGYEVRTAHSVASALQLVAAEPFDVVVSDIGLPDATGYQLMEQIRDRHGIKGIALSGYGMEEDMRKSREAGFIEHMVKPVNVAQLAAMIKRVAAG